ncbi:MAG TPA: SPOR domain-containing protein [Thermoanaerobaculia bacterium]
MTAGQAFVAFVLLLLSLAASFAFGLMIGKGQADERLVVRKEPAVINEASTVPKKDSGNIVELNVEDDDFEQKAAPATDTAASAVVDDAASSSDAPVTDAPAIVEEAPTTGPAAETPAPAPVAATPAPAPAPAPAHAAVTKPAAAAPAGGPVYAQLLSTGDVKTAEGLAAKLIDRGFNTAYVLRGTNEKGTIYRVRVKFSSEKEARAAENKLHEFSKDVWITRQ